MNKKIKKLEKLQAFVDIFAVFISWGAAFFFKYELINNQSNYFAFDLHWKFGVLLLIIAWITFKNTHLYDPYYKVSFFKDVFRVLKANAFSFLVFVLVAFFLSKSRISRLVLINYFVLSSTLLIVSRALIRKLKSKVKVQFILIGNSDAIVSYYHKIQSYNNIFVKYWVDAPNGEINFNGERRDELDFSSLESSDVDRVVVSYSNDEVAKCNELLSRLADFIVPVVHLPQLSTNHIGYSYREFQGLPVFYINEPKLSKSGLLLKRIFDFTASLIGMILISPLLLVIAFAVKFSSRGPVFYGQVRTGLDGKNFKMWKFRSMVVGDANHGGWTVKDDPRVTAVGNFLRKTSLDELPQLWNVVVGDMSLVGPRPERPQYVEKFRQDIPGYMIRHKLKAGITGWAQINGWRGDTSIPKRIECDLWYIKNWSFSLDISILFMTFFKGFVNKNAY